MSIKLNQTCDMHVHLRDGAMCKLVTPTIEQGGIETVYIMPNLQPPVTTKEQVIKYKKTLTQLSPNTQFLMSLYLCKDLTPELVEDCAKLNLIHGIKCYPAGVTTNSTAGVDPNDFSLFYPIFKVMEQNNLVLNLHGEKPSTKDSNITVLNAEEKFLPALEKLHKDFPNLKIVLEHCTTAKAIETIEKINKGITDPKDVKVAASITVHHLFITVDDWAGNPINFCKPVAKLPTDKSALIEAAISGKPYFIFGSDSAPHPVENKSKFIGVSAGIFTQSHALQLLAEIFDVHNALNNLNKFVSLNPTAFYNVKRHDDCKIELIKRKNVIPNKLTDGNITVVPFMAGTELKWEINWL